ncbi:MAG: hypothetical protein KAI67_05260 [Candidatus Pacebacteria bacterium]|nr:hypothetical protein [Candidatus Paceibacterota bacterium]
MNFEKYEIEQGNIMIAFSDENLSIGTLEIKSNQELAKHNRPVLESLYQLKGKCIIKLFKEDGSVREIVLSEGESIDIPSFQFHVHCNSFEENSITFWKASGDITGIIEKIRESSRM